MNNKERASLTYQEIQKRKKSEQKNREKEISLYQLDNILKIRRRTR